MKIKLSANIIIFFIISIVMIVSSVFAWVNISRRSEFNGSGGPVPDYSNLISFWVQRKDELDFTEITTIEDMYASFGNTRPGESYLFKFVVENTTETTINLIFEIKGITTHFEIADYDLRDVFYIDEGLINISYYDINTNEFIGEINHVLALTSQTAAEKHDQELSLYRLNNLISDSTNNLILAPIIEVDKSVKTVITFLLVYDEDTEDISYQENELKIVGIYLYGQ